MVAKLAGARCPAMHTCVPSALSPAPYVKVYLLDNGVCIAKKKTKVARKTLEPLYQQLLSFEESPQGKVLQVLACCSPPFPESHCVHCPHCRSALKCRPACVL